MDWSRDTLKKVRGLILFTILILVGLWKYDIVLNMLAFVWEIVFPFVLGGSIAFVINVPMSFLERKVFGKIVKGKKKFVRPISMILTFLIVIGVLVLIVFVAVPQLVATFASLAESIVAFLPTMRNWIRDLTNNNQDIMKLVNQINFNPQQIIQWGVTFVGTGAETMMTSTVEVVGRIASGVATFFIAFSFACYILIQKEKLHVQVRKVLFAFVPRGKGEVAQEVCSLAYVTFSNFLTGQCVEAIILGSMFVVVMSIIGLPYALLIGTIIAFTALIPMFGAFIGCGLGAFMIFIQSPKQALIFIVLFLILQQVEGNFVYPHVVGNSVGLPSIWVLAAVSIGGNLMGVVGMLIFIPLASVVYALFREYVYLKLKKQRIKNVTTTTVEEYTPEEIEKMKMAFAKEHGENAEDKTE